MGRNITNEVVHTRQRPREGRDLKGREKSKRWDLHKTGESGLREGKSSTKVEGKVVPKVRVCQN